MIKKYLICKLEFKQMDYGKFSLIEMDSLENYNDAIEKIESLLKSSPNRRFVIIEEYELLKNK